MIGRLCDPHRLQDGATSEDRRFSLEAVDCPGACGLAPVMVLDKEIYGDIKADKVIDILEKYQ